MQAPAAGHSPRRDVCGSRKSQGAKCTSLVQINLRPKKINLEDEEPLPSNRENSTPLLDVARVTSSVATLHTRVAPPGEDLNSRTLVATPVKDSRGKPSVSASLHPEAAPRGQQPYQGQTPSVGSKLLLEFKQVSILLRNHMILRLRQWRELAENMGHQRDSNVTLALVAIGGLIVIMFVMEHVESWGWRQPSHKDEGPAMSDRA